MKNTVTVADKTNAREHVMPETTFEILMEMPGSKGRYELVSAPEPAPETPPAPAEGKKRNPKTESEVQ
jgi:hypothetical protein